MTLTEKLDPVEAAVLYAAGALPPEEAEALADDADFQAAFAKFAAVTSALFTASAPVAPAPRIRESLLARMDREDRQIATSRHAEAQWRPTGTVGVAVRELFRDPRRRSVTMVVKLDAGAEWMPDMIDGAEECYVIDGEVEKFDRVFKPGDCIRTPGGAKRGIVRSQGGCLLHVTTGLSE